MKILQKAGIDDFRGGDMIACPTVVANGSTHMSCTKHIVMEVFWHCCRYVVYANGQKPHHTHDLKSALEFYNDIL